jgi:hypothetical protein
MRFKAETREDHIFDAAEGEERTLVARQGRLAAWPGSLVQVVERLRTVRRQARTGAETLKDLVEEGRRF